MAKPPPAPKTANLPATAERPTKLDEYRFAVLPPERARELYTSLPSHIKPAVFERNLINALMANPDLMDYDPRLIFREVSKAAGLGLLLDPLLGEAYIVTAYNYKSKRTEPQLRVGYKGMNKLARQSGDVANIYCHEIYSLDEVECDLGFPKVFHHRPKLFGDRGVIVGYVALISFKDGTFDFEPMSQEECFEIRDRSDAWKAYKSGKIKTTPWATDEVEMSKKTALRRLMKRQQQSPELLEAIRMEDEGEHHDAPRIAPSPRRVPSPTAPQDEIQETDIIDAEVTDDRAVEEPPPGDAKIPPKAKSSNTPDHMTDLDSYMAYCIDKLGSAQSGEELEAFFNDNIEAVRAQLFPGDYDDLLEIYQSNERKFEA